MSTVCVLPVDLHLQRPDPGCHFDDTGDLGIGDPCRERMGAQPQVEVEDHRPVLDEDGAVPAPAVRDLRRVAVGGAHREHAGRVLVAWRDGRRARRAAGTHEAHDVAGRELPNFHRSALVTVTGHTKPPRLGPSGGRG